MRTVAFFYRRKNPFFFSIEQLFEQVAYQMEQSAGAGFRISQIRLPLPSRPQHLLSNIRYARSRQAEINHVTGDVHYILMGFSARKINVLTVHDCVMLHRLRRTDLRYWVIKTIWYDWPVRKADVITVVSETTKADLIRFTGCDGGKIRVIPNFVDPAFRPQPYPPVNGPFKILFVGTTENKNLHRLSAALEGLPAELDIIGHLDQQQIASLQKRNIPFSQSAGLSKEEILQHYRDCHLLAFPSTFEGFGLPVIEGQSIGRPVLTSNLSPMREVAGEGACLVDPFDQLSIRSGLLRIMEDPAYREQLVQAGLANAAKYSLEAVTGQYAALYRECLLQKAAKADGLPVRE